MELLRGTVLERCRPVLETLGQQPGVRRGLVLTPLVFRSGVRAPGIGAGDGVGDVEGAPSQEEPRLLSFVRCSGFVPHSGLFCEGLVVSRTWYWAGSECAVGTLLPKDGPRSRQVSPLCLRREGKGSP